MCVRDVYVCVCKRARVCVCLCVCVCGNIRIFSLGAPDLKALHRLTFSHSHVLRVDLEDWDGNKFLATYRNFSVFDSSYNYRLHLDSLMGLGGTAGG